MSTLTTGVYTAHEGEDQEDYAVRLASIVSPAVSTEAETTYGGDLVNAIPLMILLTMAEKIAALGGPVATQDDIDVYDLVYRQARPYGTVVVNNDQMNYEDGHVSVGWYPVCSWDNAGEGQVLEFDNLDTAAVHAHSLIVDHP